LSFISLILHSVPGIGGTKRSINTTHKTPLYILRCVPS
jgi:hypothetical protein